MAIETLSAEDFLPHVGQRFPLAEGGGTQALELLSVTPARRVAPDQRTGFSLLFHSATSTVLDQTVLKLVHPTRGEFSLFVVPIGQDADGVQIEAIFN
jgi:hypothetical protein